MLFFEHLPAWQKLAWIVICMSACWMLEGQYPLFRFQYQKWKHAKVNFVFLFTTLLINLGFGALTLGVFTWIEQNQIGLYYLVNWPLWAKFLLALAIMDLIAQYFVHFLLHKIRFMWRFHLIHHSDTKVDVTTGTRHHPVDYLFREVFSLIAVIISGAPLAFYLAYRIITVFFTYFTHANITVPEWLDSPLRLLFVTPNLHKFHHHHERPWTDSNYGNILSVWDRLFGTYTYGKLQEVHYGLDILNPEKDEEIAYQMALPFTIKQLDKPMQAERR